MFYVGYFSFDELGPEKEVRHGYFSCIVEADDADAAANAFKALIFLQKKRNDIFGNIVAVYMEDVIEIQHIPREAIITRFQSSEGEFPKSVSRSLPDVAALGISAYGWTPDIEQNEPGQYKMEYKPAKPFIKF